MNRTGIQLSLAHEVRTDIVQGHSQRSNAPVRVGSTFLCTPSSPPVRRAKRQQRGRREAWTGQRVVRLRTVTARFGLSAAGGEDGRQRRLPSAPLVDSLNPGPCSALRRAVPIFKAAAAKFSLFFLSLYALIPGVW
jgi:hypothetical protein